jgi:hypothetical protein
MTAGVAAFAVAATVTAAMAHSAAVAAATAADAAARTTVYSLHHHSRIHRAAVVKLLANQ